MKENFDHFLLTRFNLEKSDWKIDKNDFKVLDEVWLRKRIELFEKFCFPSVLNQSNRNFKWLIFFQKETESDLKELLKKLGKFNFIEPIFLNGYKEFQALLPSIISKRLSGDKGWVLTTRLDNDDALNKKFVAGLKEAVTEAKDPTLFYFLNGLYLDLGKQNRLAAAEYPFNQFLSFLEKTNTDRLETVLSRAHDDWSGVNVTVLKSKDAWLQVTHSSNMANTFKGVPVFSYRLKNFSIQKAKFNWNYNIVLMIKEVKRKLIFLSY